MLCLFFVQNYLSYRTPEKHKRKKANTQMHNNPSFLKGFRRFLTGVSYGLPLEA